jgi:ferredoxin-NADP reductase
MNPADTSLRETTLLRSKTVAENTMAFHFSRPPGFRHRAGQSISLTLPGLPVAGGSTTRRFTIASAPHETELMVATRLRDTAFKRALKTAPPGTVAMLDGPAGDMVLHEDVTRPAVFLAGGIGITPFLAMARHATHEQLPQRLRLFYSSTRPEDAPFLDELEEMQYLNPNYRLIATMVEPEKSIDSWWGETGFIARGMLERYLAGILAPVYYIAGPAPMTKAMQQMLQAMGVDDRDVRCETFHGY